MVPDPDGPGFNYLCDPAVMEPGSRCRDADLENGVVRSDIRCVGNHFWLPLAQLTDPACALINRNLVRPLALASAFKADSKEHEPNRQRLRDKFFDSAIDAGQMCHPLALRPFRRQNAFFALPNAFAVVLLEKNAAWCHRLGDYSTALEYEPPRVLRRIRDSEDKPIFRAPTV